MPPPRKVLNAFPTEEVANLTRLSRPMIDYLRQENFLRPAYEGGEGTRGKVRYYSYRDLVIARLVQRLRESGVQLRRLKKAITALNKDPNWSAAPDDPARKISWLISDGVGVYVQTDKEFVEEITTGQKAFAFVLNLDRLNNEVLRKVSKRKKPHCSIDNDGEVKFDDERPNRSKPEKAKSGR
jgi:DNA-binding transcriptional MerR regulator